MTDIVEQFHVEAFVSEFSIETFVVRVLPWFVRFDGRIKVREVVHYDKYFQLSTVFSGVVYEVVSPNVARVFGPTRNFSDVFPALFRPPPD